MRNAGAVIVGLVVGMMVNMALVMLNAYVLFPMPEGMDMMDPDQLNTYIVTLPPQAFITIIAAHLGQSFVGGWVAARLGSSHPIRLAMIVGVISLIGGILNAMEIHAPSWTLIEMPLYLVVAYAAGWLETKRRAGA